MAVYDSKKLREIAQRLRQLAGGMESEVKPGLRGALESTEPLQGRTADVMREQLERFRQNADALAQQYAELGRLTQAYADRLEEIDDELAQEL